MEGVMGLKKKQKTMDRHLHQGIILVAMGLPNPLQVMDLPQHQMAMERVIYPHPQVAMELIKHQVAMIVNDYHGHLIGDSCSSECLDVP